MENITQGRVAELPNATNQERKAISRVVSAVMAARGLNFEKIYGQAVGSMQGYSLEDRKNLQKGLIAQWKAAKLYRWIVEHHLPLGCRIAPEVFDPSLLTDWRDFIREHGIYDRLTFSFADQLGLTQRSRKMPVADIPIPMGKPYLFDLDCGVSGLLLALEANGDNTYPFSLHPDETSILLDIEAGQQTLPVKTDGTPDPLSETEDKGLRCYAFVIAAPEIMVKVAEGLHEAHPIGLDKLDQIALAFKDVDPATFEVHRLNVVFN